MSFWGAGEVQGHPEFGVGCFDTSCICPGRVDIHSFVWNISGLSVLGNLIMLGIEDGNGVLENYETISRRTAPRAVYKVSLMSAACFASVTFSDSCTMSCHQS